MIDNLHWIAIVLAMVGAMIVGAIWFSPVLFAKTWMAEMGRTPEQFGSPLPAMINAVIMYFIASIAMAVVFRGADIHDVPDALAMAALLWVGFVGSMQLLIDRFRGASLKLVMITAGNTLVAFLVMGAILVLAD